MGIVNDYGNFLRNDQAGDSQWKYEMIGNLRPNESVADARWTPGPVQVNDEYGRNNTAVTYDSGGANSLPDGSSPDYSSLATAESAWDIDLTGYERVGLDVFDSTTHSDSYYAAGATNTSATTYRYIRSSPKCAKPFDGRSGYGAALTSASIFGTIQYGETFGQIECITALMVANSSGQSKAIALGGADTKAIFVRAKATQAGTGNGNGFRNTGARTLSYGCLAYDCDDYGFYLNGGSTCVIACTCVGTVGLGNGFCSFGALVEAFSCYGADNTNADFRDDSSYWGSWSNYNTSKDTTADLGGSAANFNNSITLEYTDGIITEDNSYGRNPYNDVTGTIDYDDFLRNDTSGSPMFSKDLMSGTRPNESVADATWGTGANQFYTFPVITFVPRITWIL
jgi:hypothetical protein